MKPGIAKNELEYVKQERTWLTHVEALAMFDGGTTNSLVVRKGMAGSGLRAGWTELTRSSSNQLRQ